MRPVNLIPPEDRRGEKAPLRTGPLAYVLVAVLAVALVGVTLVILTNNKISDREAKKTSLETQVDQTQAEAKKLEPFVNFAALQDARQQTVNSLATSRFDWERVLRELAIVIPSDVWLTNVDAAAAGGASASSSSSSSSTASVDGPSLDIQGCATGHDAVAEFLVALREIDGVTRATVMSSDHQSDSGTSGSSSSSTSSGSTGVGCAPKNFIVSFEVVVAFDSARPAAAPESGSATSSPSTATPASDSESTSAGSGSGQTQASAADGGSESDAQGGGAFVSGTGSAP